MKYGFLFALTALLLTGCSSATNESLAPSPRSGFGLAYDEERQELVLFGGSDSANVRLGDTWTWSDGTWTLHDVEGPAPRSDLQIAYDAGRAQTVVFGGLSEDGLKGDTWAWDGSEWSLLDSSGPPVRQLAMMTYDIGHQELVLFGGSGLNRTRLGDTWTRNGSSWIQQEPQTAPTARGAYQMAYDHVNNRTVLVGGWDTTSAIDTWAWDGSTWSLIDSTSTPPRLHGSMIFDHDRDALLLFGGFGSSGRESSVWIRENDSWAPSEVSEERPEIRAEHDGVYHPDLGYVTFGGIVGEGMALADRVKSNELWSLKDGVWTRH